jgi:hypothetical protein
MVNSTTIVTNSTNPLGRSNQNGTISVAPVNDNVTFPRPKTSYTNGIKSTDMLRENINSTLYYSDNNLNSFSNDNSTSQIDIITANRSGEQISPGVAVWSCVLILVFCMSIRPTIPDPSLRTALIRHRRREERKKDPQRRVRIVESSLVTMVSTVLTVNSIIQRQSHVQRFPVRSCPH